MNEITNCLARMFVYLLKVLSLLRLRKYEVGLAACIGLAVGSHTTGDYCKRGRARRRPYKAGHSLYGSGTSWLTSTLQGDEAAWVSISRLG
ncbi:hypothetical protein MCOR03_005696 [Pyricularia oryzae]|nr:hypothetical protein MCOR21_003933 [Pyricularia oryzae]KAI6557669.1 hypothetical protein MCOR03_005696 [Pyricularia oryzae]